MARCPSSQCGHAMQRRPVSTLHNNNTPTTPVVRWAPRGDRSGDQDNMMNRKKLSEGGDEKNARNNNNTINISTIAALAKTYGGGGSRNLKIEGEDILEFMLPPSDLLRTLKDKRRSNIIMNLLFLPVIWLHCAFGLPY